MLSHADMIVSDILEDQRYIIKKMNLIKSRQDDISKYLLKLNFKNYKDKMMVIFPHFNHISKPENYEKSTERKNSKVRKSNLYMHINKSKNINT